MFKVQQKSCGSRLRLGLLFGCLAAEALWIGRAAAQPSPPQPEAPASAPAGSVGGFGDVNIYPKRVVIDGKQRIGSIGLFNRSSAPGEYDIEVIDMMMTGDGRIVQLSTVTDEAERARVKSALALLRWSPHRVSLRGHDAQTVRVMVRTPPDLPPGEYRSHFQIISEPDINEGYSIDNAAAGSKPDGIGVRILPRYGISIPVIVRVGETTLNVGIRNIALVTTADGGKAITVSLTRQGTRSAFGDLKVLPAGSKTPIATAAGVGLYTEIDERTVQVSIDPKADQRLYVKGARLTLTYTDDDASPGTVLAKQEFVVP